MGGKKLFRNLRDQLVGLMMKLLKSIANLSMILLKKVIMKMQ